VVLLIFLISIWFPPKTPDFPEPPESYSPWTKYESVLYKPLLRVLSDDTNSSKPFTLITTDLIEACHGGDSLSKFVHYVTDTSIWLKNNWGYGDVYIRWAVHQTDSIDIYGSLLPLHLYWHSWSLFLSKDIHLDTISISENIAYRQRGWFWAGQCDWGSQWVGSYTAYFIPSKTYDFRITCTTMLYSYSHEEEQINTYPNHNTILEQVIEETFKSK
jgi:hypothetical protein